jgi:hypothetical protein
MQDGSLASMPYLSIHITQEHMNDDDIIIGLIFELAVEGKGYCIHHDHGMRKS